MAAESLDLFDNDADYDFSDDEFEDPQPWDGVSEPDVDSFETYAEYEDAQTQYRTDQAVAARHPEGPGRPLSQSQELAPYPDDPQGADRADNEAFLAQAEKEKADAQDRGDAEAVRDWSRARQDDKKRTETPGSNTPGKV
jgi:hypothetical protein